MFKTHLDLKKREIGFYKRRLLVICVTAFFNKNHFLETTNEQLLPALQYILQSLKMNRTLGDILL